MEFSRSRILHFVDDRIFKHKSMPYENLSVYILLEYSLAFITDGLVRAYWTTCNIGRNKNQVGKHK